MYAVLAPTAVDPVLTALAMELRPVVGPNMARNTAEDEEVRQNVDDIRRVEPASDPDAEAFVRELVNHIQHPDFASIVGAIFHEVVGPDVVGMLAAYNACSVVQPEPSALGLLGWQLQSPTRKELSGFSRL